jgi:hypothetical protein
MTFKFLDRVRMSFASAPGAGAATLGGPLNGYQSFAAAGAVDGDTFPYLIEDGSDWEYGVGTYTASTNQVARAMTKSSTGSLLVATSSAKVSATLRAEDLASVGAGVTLGVNNAGVAVDAAAASLNFVNATSVTADGAHNVTVTLPTGSGGGGGGIAGISVYQDGSRVGAANQFQAINFKGANAAIVANGSNADVTMNVGGSSGGGGGAALTPPLIAKVVSHSQHTGAVYYGMGDPDIGSSHGGDAPTVGNTWVALLFHDPAAQINTGSYAGGDGHHASWQIVSTQPTSGGDTVTILKRYIDGEDNNNLNPPPFFLTSGTSGSPNVAYTATVFEVMGLGGIGDVALLANYFTTQAFLTVNASKASVVVGAFSVLGDRTPPSTFTVSAPDGAASTSTDPWALASATIDAASGTDGVTVDTTVDNATYPAPDGILRSVTSFRKAAMAVNGPVKAKVNWGSNNAIYGIALVLLGG